MVQKVKKEVLQIYHKLKSSGFEVYLVGGCVRDIIGDRNVKDWDLATNATPEQIQIVFPDSFYDNSFGTVGVSLAGVEEEEHGGIAEITTFRTETSYKDHRHPEKVVWGKTIEEDLQRRDFTINAIAIKIEGNKREIIDPYKGREDLENKLVRAVGNPDERFNEDALRLMRAIRLATVLNFTIEGKTWDAVIKNASLISHVSKERVRDEFLKILASDSSYEGIEMLHKTGILNVILPELIKGKGVSQVRPGRHHTTDVFEHNTLSLKHCPSKDPIVKFATLLHDVGKPDVAAKDPEGHVIFYNHEVKGAYIAKEISERLKFSKKQKDKIFILIRWHMFTVDVNITDAAIRRFIRRVGVDNVNDMIDLRIGDRLGGGTQFAESWRLKKFKERLSQQLHPPFSINDLAIDGNDIMRELNIEPGPKIGEILQKLFGEVDEDLSKNTREHLIPRIHELGK